MSAGSVPGGTEAVCRATAGDEENLPVLPKTLQQEIFSQVSTRVLKVRFLTRNVQAQLFEWREIHRGHVG